MRTATATLAALLLTACYPTADLAPCTETSAPLIEGPCSAGTLVYDEHAWSADEKAWLRLAAARWNEFAGVDVVRVVPGRSGCQIVAGATDDGSPIEFDSAAGVLTIDREAVAAASERRLDLSELRTERDGGAMVTTAMHAFGHVLGLPHDDDGVLSPWGADEFTEGDRAACREVGLCRW